MSKDTGRSLLGLLNVNGDLLAKKFLRYMSLDWRISKSRGYVDFIRGKGDVRDLSSVHCRGE